MDDLAVKVGGNKPPILYTPEDVGKYVPLFRIRITSEGIPCNAYRGCVFVRVFILNENDFKYKDYAIYVSTKSNSDVTHVIKLYDLNKEISFIYCVLDDDGTYATFYTKIQSIYHASTYQILYASYPSFIEELPDITPVSSFISEITPFDYCMQRSINWSEISFTNNWFKNSNYNNRYELAKGRFYFEIYISGGLMTDGTIVATVKSSPQYPVRVRGECYDESNDISNCYFELGIDKIIRIYKCTANTLVKFQFSYEIVL